MFGIRFNFHAHPFIGYMVVPLRLRRLRVQGTSELVQPTMIQSVAGHAQQVVWTCAPCNRGISRACVRSFDTLCVRVMLATDDEHI